ncbi:PD-(D/E)XK nuclease family protein [Polycyclovorans algicola]|uniref:PD-(D/E)XK nuclease family protein n=1 Tax=Polycyclovorans algicola TaxID=616992 RepID=UPI0004A6DE91|nr:PD-(D/E)XK nuclease family protein [Polycyclovorans algicola]
MTVLLPNDLAAREAGFDYAMTQRAAGAQVWTPPGFIGFTRHIEQRWAAGWPAEGLINDVQRLALWQMVLTEDAQTPPLLAPQATARLAMTADDLQHHYRLRTGAPLYTLEQRLFQRWQAEVQTRMTALKVLPASHLPDQLLAQPPPTTPPAVQHPQGWGPLLPSHQALWAHWGLPAADTAARPLPTVQVCPDRHSQFRAIAERVLQMLNDQPDARVLLVVDDLDSHRAGLDAALTEVLAPWRHQPGLSDRLPWRWASAGRLRDTALATGWLSLASLSLRPQRSHDWQTILLNPALLGGDAALAAAKLDARILDAGWTQLAAQELLTLSPPSLHQRLAALIAVLEQAPRRALPSDWQAHLLARLRAIRPLGATQADSHLFQLERRLFEASERLGQLDRLLGPISASAAQQWLGEVLNSPFQPRVEHAQPILIGTAAQLLGIPSDRLIFANVETTARSAGPHPLLPFAEQRDGGVPDADPLLAAANARAVRQALMALAQHCEAFMPAVDSLGQPLTPPAGCDLEPHAAPPRRSRALPDPALPEDDPVPVLRPAEEVAASAGTFERFFVAPLLTVVVDRLSSKPLPRRTRGVPPGVQGRLSHDALMHFWKTHKTSAALHSLAPNSFEAAIGEAVDAAIASGLHARHFGAAWVALERRRLISQLAEWLGHERRRSEPFTVIACEKSLRTEWDTLPIHLRLDRADSVTTADGPQVLLIDYKTGADANPSGWKGDHLKAPQLPLYAVLARQLPDFQPLGGIAFAHLKAGHPALSARTAWAQYLIPPTKKTNTRTQSLTWPEQLAAWEYTLRDAATAIQEGCAGVDPARLTQNHAPYRDLVDPDVNDDGESDE